MKIWLLALGFTLGCRAQSAPSLLELGELSAREIGVGDRLELRGTGFPEGRVARLTFRGDVFRPGRPTAEDIELSIPAQTSTPHLLTATVSEAMVNELCGHDDPAHATFRGDLLASFAPRKSGAPPVSGVLPGIVLDVESSREGERAEREGRAEGLRFAQFLGLTLGADGDGPLRVEKVERTGPGAAAGLLAGDVLEELSGVRLGALSDFVPPPRARVARLFVRRTSEDAGVLAIDVSSFRPGALSDLIPALAVLGSALLLIWLTFSAVGRAVAWASNQLVRRARAELVHTRAGALRPLRALGRGISRALPSTSLAHGGVLVGSAALSLLALGVPLVARELDLPIVFLAIVSALTVSGFLAESSGQMRVAWLRSARRAALVLLAQLPLGAALLCGVLSAGSLRIDDLAAAQAGSPWRFTAFESPIHFVALLLGVLSLVPEATRRSKALGLAATPPSRSLEFVEWLHLVLAAGLISCALLGGFSVPGLSELDRTGSRGGLALGAALLLFKTFSLVLGVATLRWALGRVSVEQCGTVLVRVAAPVSLAAPVAAQLWALSLEARLLASCRTAVALSLFVASGLGAALLVRRLLQGLALPRAEPNINPWL